MAGVLTFVHTEGGALTAVFQGSQDLDCTHGASGWSVVSAAGSFSVLGGGIASVLLAVVLLILGVRFDKGEPQEKRLVALQLIPLRLLMPTLAGMVLASLLFANISGEVNCVRASAVTIPAAGLLGVSSLGAFVAITWTLKAHMAENQKILSGAYRAVGVIWIAAGTMLGLSIGNAYHHRFDVTGGANSHGTSWASNLTVLAVDVVIVVSLALAALLHRKCQLKGFRNGSQILKEGEFVSQASRWLTWSVITLYALYLIAISRPADEWNISRSIGVSWWWLPTLTILATGVGAYRVLLALPSDMSVGRPMRWLLGRIKHS